MRINHLFINSLDVEKSTRFYCDLLGFVPTKTFNEGLGVCQIVHKNVPGGDFDLLIVPTGTEKILYAQHIAFEVDSEDEFEAVLQNAKAMGLKARSGVPLESEAGVSNLSVNGKTYRHFYVLDPSWVNIEVMLRVMA